MSEVPIQATQTPRTHPPTGYLFWGISLSIAREGMENPHSEKVYL